MESVFASDVELSNQYYCVLVRADKIGKIVGVECPSFNDNVFFITHKDIKGKNAISLFGQEMPIFASEKIEYVGQVFGVVASDDEENAKLIAGKIKVLVEEEKKVNILLKPETLESVFFQYENQIISKQEKKADGIEECFKEEKNITKSFLHFESRSHYHAEPISVKVRAKQNSIDVYVATQWPYHVQTSIKEALACSIEKVKVIPSNESYSLNARIWFPSLLATQVAIVADKIKKNVSITFSFKESFLYSNVSPNIAILHKSEVSQDGKIKAMSVLCVVDIGSFNLLIEQMLMQLLLTALGVYGIMLYKVEVVAIKTNTRPTDLFVNWGDYYTNTAIEKHISDIVDKFGFDPIQFRLDNILKPHEIGITGIEKKDDYKMGSLMNKACEVTTFLRKYGAYRTFNKKNTKSYENYCRGIGIAIGVQYNGLKSLIKAGANYVVEMTLNKEQELLVKAEPSTPQMKELFKNRILKVMNIEANKIIFEVRKNIEHKDVGPSLPSCTMSILPLLVDKCIAEIQKQRFREALPITCKKDYKITGRSGWDSEKLEGQPFLSETSGCCVVESYLDKSTYSVKVQKIYLALEAGDTFSKDYVISSINRSVTDSLSGVLWEKMPKSYRRASDYTIISPNEMPNVEIELFSSNATQVKGFSNLPSNLIPAALMASLNQILQSEHLNMLPITQYDIFNMLTCEKMSEGEKKTCDSEVIDENNGQLEVDNKNNELKKEEDLNDNKL